MPRGTGHSPRSLGASVSLCPRFSKTISNSKARRWEHVPHGGPSPSGHWPGPLRPGFCHFSCAIEVGGCPKPVPGAVAACPPAGLRWPFSFFPPSRPFCPVWTPRGASAASQSQQRGPPVRSLFQGVGVSCPSPPASSLPRPPAGEEETFRRPEPAPASERHFFVSRTPYPCRRVFLGVEVDVLVDRNRNSSLREPGRPPLPTARHQTHPLEVTSPLPDMLEKAPPVTVTGPCPSCPPASLNFPAARETVACEVWLTHFQTSAQAPSGAEERPRGASHTERGRGEGLHGSRTRSAHTSAWHPVSRGGLSLIPPPRAPEARVLERRREGSGWAPGPVPRAAV